jgi:ADP-ribose pyrophosphatase YjhB (NUDIX family)
MNNGDYIIAVDRQEYPFVSNGQEWLVSWHAPGEAPVGTRHGSAALCLTPEGLAVLVTEDDEAWTLPGGRPEGDESWRETLDREVLEEACAVVESATLLGYSHGQCTRGEQKGLVLIRSLWRADVQLLPWQPQHEIRSRLLLTPDEALAKLTSFEEGMLEYMAPQPLFPRLFQEALKIGPASPPVVDRINST